MHTTRLASFTFRVLAVLACAGFGTAAQAGAPARVLVDAAPTADDSLPPHALAGSGVAGALDPRALASARLSFVLPDGRTITATRQRVDDDTARGRRSWVGTFPEETGSLAVVSRYRGAVTGFLTYGAETWELMPGKAGRHRLYRVDDRKLPVTEPELVEPVADRDVAAGDTSAAIDLAVAGYGGQVQDLLVVYTTAARVRYGQATLESKILAAVAAANQAYQNSGIGITLNLVGLQETPYVESGAIQTTLNELRAAGDGRMDDVQALRNAVGADLVSLVSEDADACGIAAVMTSVSATFAPSAYSVVRSTCLSQHSLAHEIGHNQGNKHDRANATGSGAYPYSYGYRRCVSDGTGFRTVMAYSCSGAARVAWFSNPGAYYNGFSTGIAYESDPLNSADNARSMNNTAATVAAFRTAPGSSAAPPAAPTGLVASGVTFEAVGVRWSDNSSDETGFRVERSGNGVEFAEIATLGAGATGFADDGVAASSRYYYRVRAYGSGGNSAYSNVLSVATPAVPPPAPAMPASISALDGRNGSAVVSWVDAATNETAFEVRRARWDAKRSTWGAATTVGTVPADVTSLVDLCGTGTFRYTVRASNAGGSSGYAGPAAVTVTGGSSSKGRASR